jgi:uncharacterized protein YjbI with pentapeptide repeats
MVEKVKATSKCSICERPIHKESKYCIFHASVEEKTENEFIEALKEYVNNIKKEYKDYNFERFIFIGDIDFRKDLNITVFKNANFKKVTFEGATFFRNTNFQGVTLFENATFQRDAIFRDSTFLGDVDFVAAAFAETIIFFGVTFKGYANFIGVYFLGYADFREAIFERDSKFWGATFKGAAYFEEATFKEYADFRKLTFQGLNNFISTTFEGDADFGNTIFHRDALFKNSTFSGISIFGYFGEISTEDISGFNSITFEGNADFNKATFKGEVSFRRAIFKKAAVFYGTTFENIIDFTSVSFKGESDFDDGIFKDEVNFWNTTFEGFANFCNIIFERIAKFTATTFEVGVNIGNVTFKGEAYFNHATFKRFADFRYTIFEKDVNFIWATMPAGKNLTLKVKNRAILSFERTFLENVYLELDIEKEVFIDFTNAILRNTKIKKEELDSYILQEKRKEYSQAKEIYLLLKNNFHSIGRYEDESWAFKKEKDMERKSYFNFKTIHKWLWSCFLNGIYGYGERPWNVILSAGILIFAFALLFSLIGIGTPEIIELKGTAVHQNSGNIVDLVSKGLLKNNVIRNFPDSLYFSLITFTTLGYGDFRPLEGWGRILAGSEAFIGAFMMALFVYTFARRTGGR